MTRPDLPANFPHANQPQPMWDAPDHMMRPDNGLTRDDLDRMPMYRAARRDAEARREERRNAWFWRLALAAIAALAVLWGVAHAAPIAVHHYANPAVIQH